MLQSEHTSSRKALMTPLSWVAVSAMEHLPLLHPYQAFRSTSAHWLGDVPGHRQAGSRAPVLSRLPACPGSSRGITHGQDAVALRLGDRRVGPAAGELRHGLLLEFRQPAHSSFGGETAFAPTGTGQNDCPEVSARTSQIFLFAPLQRQLGREHFRKKGWRGLDCMADGAFFTKRADSRKLSNSRTVTIRGPGR